jgi:hypothetical protein
MAGTARGTGALHAPMQYMMPNYELQAQQTFDLHVFLFLWIVGRTCKTIKQRRKMRNDNGRHGYEVTIG